MHTYFLTSRTLRGAFSMRERRFYLLVPRMGHLGDMLFFGILMSMSGCAQSHKDESQEGKDKRLNETDEDFEEVERNGSYKRQQETYHQQEHITGEQVPKKTEAERDDTQRFEHQLQYSDHQNHRALFEAEVTPQLKT